MKKVSIVLSILLLLGITTSCTPLKLPFRKPNKLTNGEEQVNRLTISTSKTTLSEGKINLMLGSGALLLALFAVATTNAEIQTINNCIKIIASTLIIGKLAPEIFRKW
ncbi:MAG: hypothetical protein LBR09_02505 [Endomicrobium sp.]|jgi:hypothetical protein|nr:hypothetical protein [Endomicrobium sp.]